MQQAKTCFQALCLPAEAAGWSGKTMIEYFRMQQQKVAAFASGLNVRLGAVSPLSGLNDEILQLIHWEVFGGLTLLRQWMSQHLREANTVAHLGFPERISSQPLPDNVRVHIIGGEFDMQLGTTAQSYDHTGNGTSIPYLAVGMTHETLGREHAVIELDAGQYSCVPYSNLHLQNSELFNYMQRACKYNAQSIPAIRALGFCLTEGEGGIGQDLANGCFWTFSAANMGDAWCRQWQQRVIGEAEKWPQNPTFAFSTLKEAEDWEGWNAVGEILASNLDEESDDANADLDDANIQELQHTDADSDSDDADIRR